MKTKMILFFAILVISATGLTSCGNSQFVSRSKMNRENRKSTRIYFSPAGRNLQTTGQNHDPKCASLGMRR